MTFLYNLSLLYFFNFLLSNKVEELTSSFAVWH